VIALPNIKQILMNRDGLTESEALSLIGEAREEMSQLLEEGRMDEAYEICGDYFGLEPDYLDELI